METVTAASTYVQISREELETWLDSIGFRGKWKRDPRYAGVYLLSLSDVVGVKLSSTIGSDDDARGRGQASMQLALVSLVTGRVLNKKAQDQSHFARTKNWQKNWDAGIDKMRAAYRTAAAFYDAIAVIEDREKYKQDHLRQIEQIPGWAENNYFLNLHRKIERDGVLMRNDIEEIERALAAPKIEVVPEGSPDAPPSPEEEKKLFEKKLEALRFFWKRVNDWEPANEAAAKNREWLLDFLKSIGTSFKNGRRLSPAQLTTLSRNMDKWKIEVDGKPASEFF